MRKIVGFPGLVGQYFNQAPAFGFAKRAGLHDADLVADLRLFLLIMSVEFGRATNNLLEAWVRNATLHFDHDGLVHFVRSHNPNACLAQAVTFIDGVARRGG